MRVILTLLLTIVFAILKGQTIISAPLTMRSTSDGFYRTDTGTHLQNFVFEDEKGNKKTLADFKGKIVYMDIWATWCGNCIIRFPYARQLQRRIKMMNLDTSIVFVNINVDDTKRQWRKALNKYHPDGVNLYCSDTALYTKWNIDALPAYNLLDRSGRVLGMKIFMPDEPMSIDWVLYNAVKGVRLTEALRIKHEQEKLKEQNRSAPITDDEFAKWFKAIVPSMLEYERWRKEHIAGKSR